MSSVYSIVTLPEKQWPMVNVRSCNKPQGIFADPPPQGRYRSASFPAVVDNIENALSGTIVLNKNNNNNSSKTVSKTCNKRITNTHKTTKISEPRVTDRHAVVGFPLKKMKKTTVFCWQFHRFYCFRFNLEHDQFAAEQMHSFTSNKQAEEIPSEGLIACTRAQTRGGNVGEVLLFAQLPPGGVPTLGYAGSE